MTTSYVLEPLTLDHLEAVHAIFTDAATWQHLPEGRFRDPMQTTTMLCRFENEWSQSGLSFWAVRATEFWSGVRAGDVIGVAGVSPRAPGWWNTGYRFVPAAWGRGLASEVTGEGQRLAHELKPEWPVISRLLSSNPASERVSQRLGLELKWCGPAREGENLERLIMADRQLDPELLDQLIAMG